MTTRLAVLNHVLDILQFPQEVKDAIQEEASVKSVGLFANIEADRFLELEGVKHGHAKSMELFKLWFQDYIMMNSGTPEDWEIEFTEEVWEDFMIEQALRKLKTSPVLTSPAPVPPMVTSSSAPVVKSTTSVGLPQVKIDVKSYPEFSGTLKDWRVFKQKFMAIAQIHKISEIMGEKYVIPSNGSDKDIFDQKNTFLQSILEHSLAKGTALTRVTKHSEKQDGRESWMELNRWFEGQGSKETVAKDALTVITTHKLTSNSFGGADKYMEKFENAMQELIRIEKPYDLTMAKINFLSNIQDPEYKIVKETLEMDSNKDYNDCVIEIRKKSIVVDASRKNNGTYRRANNAQKSKKNSQANKLKEKLGAFWVPADKWKKMSQAEKDEHIKKSREARNGGKPDNSTVPKQYTSANAMTQEEKDLYAFSQSSAVSHPTLSSHSVAANSQATVVSTPDEQLTPHQIQFMNMVRSMKMVSRASMMVTRACDRKYRDSGDYDKDCLHKPGERYPHSKETSTSKTITIPNRLNKLNRTNQQIDRGELLVDGGCDTSLVGHGFKVESTTNRTVTVQGFDASMTMEELPVVSAVTAVDLEEGTFILEVNEAIHVPNNPTSLLSTFQVRENGGIVDDVSARHGGKQRIMKDGIDLPLDLQDGLLFLNTRLPTENERQNCTRIILTSDAVWNVSEFRSSACNSTLLRTEESLFAYVDLPRVLAPSKTTVEKDDLLELQSKMGWIPLKVLEKTLTCTTRLAKNSLNLPMKQHFKSRYPQLNRNRLREMYSTDTIFSSIPAIGTGCTCMQVFCGKNSKYCKGYGMKTESDGCDVLETFVAEVGAPYHLMNDNARMETSQAWKRILSKYNISGSATEPNHGHQNPVERRIQDIKKVSRAIMDHTGCPDTFWELAVTYGILLLNHTAAASLGWKTPMEKAFGVTPDISALVQFAFYEPIYFLDSDTSYPHTREIPGRFVGIAEHTGDALTYKILTPQGSIIARSVLRSALNPHHINKRDHAFSDKGEQYLNSTPFADEVRTFGHHMIHSVWDGTMVESENPVTDISSRAKKDSIPNTKITSDILQTASDITGMQDLPMVDPHSLIGFNFVMPNRNNIEEKVEVIDWKQEGHFIVQFLNGGKQKMIYNDLINHYNKNQEENAELYSFSSILDHKKDGKEWLVQVLWDAGDTTWESMKLMKEADPITLAKYGHAHNLEDQRGWKWIKRYSENDRVFINLSKAFVAKGKQKVFKFGVEIPRNLKEAMSLDASNGNELWSKATDKEITELLEHDTFGIYDTKEKIPKDHKYVPVQFVFDNKFDGRRKGRLVACGNLTNPDISDIYSGVVSIESVRWLFVIADLNGLEVIAADVCNAYLNGKTNEKLYTQIDYGKLKGKYLVIEKALYGLKTSAARWCDDISNTLFILGFVPSKADSEVWMRERDEYYEYVAVYVDDLIVVSKTPMNIISELEIVGKYRFKGVGEPEYYLGADVTRKKVPGVPYITTLSAKTYLANVCEKIERMFDCKLRNYHSPLEGGYHPELDETELLVGPEISKYRMLTGSLNWAITIGRVDVMFAGQLMARYNHAPRAGHLKVMLRIFGYLKHHGKVKLKFDVSYPEIPGGKLEKCDWKHFYPGAKEKLPHEAPSPKGKPIRVWGEKDSDNAHDLETRRSVTGFNIYMNNSLVKSYSKRQSTVETSTYGSEIVAGRIAVEHLIATRYALRMLGVPVLHESWLFGDNMAVILNCSKPESVLKKKHHACAYHFIRETVSTGWLFLIHKPSDRNRADILTKALNPAVLYSKIKGWLT